MELLRQPETRGQRRPRRLRPIGGVMSENSAYQQLRGHLATLRLSAAAEALPGVLEAATAEGLGHSAMLERLLAIEPAPTHTWRSRGRRAPSSVRRCRQAPRGCGATRS